MLLGYSVTKTVYLQLVFWDYFPQLSFRVVFVLVLEEIQEISILAETVAHHSRLIWDSLFRTDTQKDLLAIAYVWKSVSFYYLWSKGKDLVESKPIPRDLGVACYILHEEADFAPQLKVDKFI